MSSKLNPETIPLFKGTSATPFLDGLDGQPLMTLVETLPDNDERQFNIQMGLVIIGTMGLRPNNTYDLRWLLTGGCLSGQGQADINDDLGRASIAAQIFELLAHDIRVFIAETRGDDDPSCTCEEIEAGWLALEGSHHPECKLAPAAPEVGKTYRIEKDNGYGSVVGSTFKIVSANAHEFLCESDLDANRGVFGIEDFRHQVASGELVEV